MLVKSKALETDGMCFRSAIPSVCMILDKPRRPSGPQIHSSSVKGDNRSYFVRLLGQLNNV